MKPIIKILILVTVALLTLSQTAFAHVSVDHLNLSAYDSLSHGFLHPLTGADHILAMIVVGIWAFQLGGRSVWLVPCAFVATMCVGFVVALAGIQLPFIEPIILASVIVLGLIATFAVRMPTFYAMVAVGFFALFHGVAHGGEIGNAGMFSYGLGFGVATMLLHGAGIGLGVGAAMLAKVTRQSLINRIMGFVAFLSGLYLLIAG